MSRRDTRVLAILCHWCAYSASDGAAAAKLPVPANVVTLRVPCSGRVDPELVVRAMRGGADGVIVCGCHPGDCHYRRGNFQALGRVLLLKHLLADLGVAPERLRLEWVSASESRRYADLMHEMAATIDRLGPLEWPAPDAPEHALDRLAAMGGHGHG